MSLGFCYEVDFVLDDDYFFYVQCTGTSHNANVNFGQDSAFAGELTRQNNDDSGGEGFHDYRRQ